MDSTNRFRRWIACCLGRGRLSPLDADDIAALADEFGARSFAGGIQIFGEGELPARVHVVRTGRVELSKNLGGRRVGFEILRAGDVFGDVPLLMEQMEPFDARALEDSVILSMDAGALFDLLERRPQLARRWMISLAERTAGLQERIGDLLAGGLEQQIASLLLHRAVDSVVSLSQGTIAELLGTKRSSVNRILKALETADMIDVGYRRITINNRESLEDLISKSPPSRGRHESPAAGLGVTRRRSAPPQ